MDNKKKIESQRYCLFYYMHSSSLSKPGTYITHDATRPPLLKDYRDVMLEAVNVALSL